MEGKHMTKAIINVSIKTVPHPDSGRLVDVWSKLILKEIAKREVQSQ